MQDRARAITVLQQAREILAKRLTDRILDSQQDILDDAEGLHYLSEIESLYEQLGGRLAHVNTMLSNLPPVEEAYPAEMSTTETVYTDLSAAYTAGVDAGPVFSPGHLALPAPSAVDERPQLAHQPASFQTFALQIQAGDLDAAGRCLAELFAIDVPRGRRCAEVFAEQLSVHGDLHVRVGKLRAEVVGGGVNGALMLLWECFGLSGLESLGVLQALKNRFAVPTDPAGS